MFVMSVCVYICDVYMCLYVSILYICVLCIYPSPFIQSVSIPSNVSSILKIAQFHYTQKKERKKICVARLPLKAPEWPHKSQHVYLSIHTIVLLNNIYLSHKEINN